MGLVGLLVILILVGILFGVISSPFLYILAAVAALILLIDYIPVSGRSGRRW